MGLQILYSISQVFFKKPFLESFPFKKKKYVYNLHTIKFTL